MIDCVVEGDPKPMIQWDKNSRMNDFDNSRYYIYIIYIPKYDYFQFCINYFLFRFRVLENGTLFISEVYRDDENKYGCTAGNSAGLNRKEVRLIVHSNYIINRNICRINNLNKNRFIGGEGYRPDGNIEDLENEGAMITKAVLITMSVAGAYMILVIGLMVWCRYRRKARKLAINAEGNVIKH